MYSSQDSLEVCTLRLGQPRLDSSDMADVTLVFSNPEGIQGSQEYNDTSKDKDLTRRSLSRQGRLGLQCRQWQLAMSVCVARSSARRTSNLNLVVFFHFGSFFRYLNTKHACNLSKNFLRNK